MRATGATGVLCSIYVKYAAIKFEVTRQELTAVTFGNALNDLAHSRIARGIAIANLILGKNIVCFCTRKLATEGVHVQAI